MVFEENRHYPILENIIAPMETKLNKYFKNVPCLFYFDTVIDPHTKLDRIEYLITEFYKNRYDESNIHEL